MRSRDLVLSADASAEPLPLTGPSPPLPPQERRMEEAERMRELYER